MKTMNTCMMIASQPYETRTSPLGKSKWKRVFVRRIIAKCKRN